MQRGIVIYKSNDFAVVGAAGIEEVSFLEEELATAARSVKQYPFATRLPGVATDQQRNEFFGKPVDEPDADDRRMTQTAEDRRSQQGLDRLGRIDEYHDRRTDDETAPEAERDGERITGSGARPDDLVGAEQGEQCEGRCNPDGQAKEPSFPS